MGTETVAEFRSKIAPELQALARPIADATPHPDNARKHSLPKIARSLNDHGQRSPIVVQASTGWIVKGNGTWTAAAQILGWTEIAQQWQELGDDEALAYLLADNKASDESGYDNAKLVKALNKLVDGPGLLDTLWSGEELEDLVEGEAGAVVLDGAVTEGEFADAAYKDQRDARGAAAGAKHKEVPLVMTVADHAAFVERLGVLRKAFGTSGTVLTIIEAVKRQASEEESAAVGAVPDELMRKRVRRELVKELRDILLADPRWETPTRTALIGLLESIEPFREASPLRDTSQTEAFPELTPVVAEATEDAPSDPADEDVARYRRKPEATGEEAI